MSRDQSLSIEFRGVEFEVSFDFQPEEKEVRYYSDGTGYPGCPASIDITSVDLEGEEWIDSLTEKALEDIEQSIWNYREDY